MRYYLRLLLLFILLAPALSGRAQTLPPDTLFNDSFRVNERNWLIETTDQRQIDFTAAGYRLRCLGPDPANALVSTITVYLNDTRDWSLTARVRVHGCAGLFVGNRFATAGAPVDFYVYLLNQGAVPAQVELWHFAGTWTKLVAEPVPPGFDAGAAHVLQLAREGERLCCFLDGQRLSADAPLARWPVGTHELGFQAQSIGAELLVSQLLVRHRSLVRRAPGVPRELRRERLAGGISTPAEELNPCVSADGRSLYFVRSTGNPAVPKEKNQDIFVAERGANGSWGEARNLGSPINTPGNNLTVHVAPDGQSLLVTGQYNDAGTYVSNGVSQTTQQADGTWTRPLSYTEGLDIPNVGDYINKWIDASGTVALISCDTKENLGKNDLYFSLRRPDGSWSPLQSMGPTLNTPGDDQTPFLAADGKTLYFSSDGHPGYGHLDVFMSTRLDETWTKWSPPLNLGPAVNTPGYDSYFSLPASGEYAYMVSKEPSTDLYDTDIYRLLLPAALKPAPTVLVRGRVLDARTNQVIANADMHYEQLPAGKEVGHLLLGGAGTYEIVLPAGQAYGFRAEATGYVSASDNLDLSTVTAYREVTQDLYLLPLAQPVEPLVATAAKVNAGAPGAAVPQQVRGVTPAKPVPPAEERIVLNNVFFERGKPVLLPNSFPELQRLAQTLQQNPGLRIRLDGHTDNTGDDKNPKPNQVLSEQRVAAVKAYLVKRGMAAGRLETRGYGGSRPVAPNDTENNKRKNRRVEFVVVSR